MSITFDVLGGPGQDNALLVKIDSGQGVQRLLFDCGEGCLNSVAFADIQAIDHLFFSHLHMDHVAGFDAFVRAVFQRTSKPNHLWGPEGTAQILHHRFQGFLWNLHQEMSATWNLHDICSDAVHGWRIELGEAFQNLHPQTSCDYRVPFLDSEHFSVEAHIMNHRTQSLAYVVREKSRCNIDIDKMDAMGLKPGAWLKTLKLSQPPENLVIDQKTYRTRELQEALLTETPGEAIAYLTDFLLDAQAMKHLASVLNGCQTVVCEAQYCNEDEELARRHYHMTTGQVAKLARRASIGQLILIHLSVRYDSLKWQEMLAEVRSVFPDTFFARHWNL